LLVRGGIQVMSDRDLSFANLPWICQPDAIARWLSGLILAVVLLAITKRYQHYLVMPSCLLLAIGLFYLALWGSHTPIAEARSAGWLLGPFPKGGLWQPLMLPELSSINWSVILEQAGIIATLMFISLLSLVLTNSGIELAVERDIDLNTELQAVGIANLAAGIGSGMAGNQALPSTLLVHKMGAKNRLSGVFKTVPCTAVLVLGSSFLSFFPKPILGSLLLYLGIDLLIQWVYKAASKLPRSDYLTVLLILVVINAVGFLEGVVVGLILSVLLFVVKYSRINVAKNELSGATQQSHVERTAEQRQLLQQQGEAIYILQLHGFIFFGTANRLLKQVRDRIAQAPHNPLRFIVLDFHLVSGIDSSAVLSFSKMAKLVQQQNLTLAFAGVEPQVEALLHQGDVLADPPPNIQIFPDFDRGLAWCEDRILQLEGKAEPSAVISV